MKKIFFIMSLLIVGLSFLYLRHIYGWYELKLYKKTPKEYVNDTVVNKKKYSLDSAIIALSKVYFFLYNSGGR